MKNILKQGYGIMPNVVLFDPDVNSTAKLLYCYISSLCARDGFCRATNKHFAEKFQVTSRQIFTLLNEISKYLNIPAHEKGKRIIYLAEVNSDKIDAEENFRTSGRKLPTVTDAINIINKKYTPAEQKQALDLHMGFIRHFKLDIDDYQLSDSQRQKELLDKAARSYKLTDKRLIKTIARLRDAGFEMCKLAIINAAKDPFNHGENDRHWELDLYDYLFRSYENVEKWANKKGYGND
jgi:hypothetical protein